MWTCAAPYSLLMHTLGRKHHTRSHTHTQLWVLTCCTLCCHCPSWMQAAGRVCQGGCSAWPRQRFWCQWVNIQQCQTQLLWFWLLALFPLFSLLLQSFTCPFHFFPNFLLPCSKLTLTPWLQFNLADGHHPFSMISCSLLHSDRFRYFNSHSYLNSCCCSGYFTKDGPCEHLCKEKNNMRNSLNIPSASSNAN